MIYTLAAVMAMCTANQAVGIDIFIKIANGEILSFDVNPDVTIGRLIEQVDSYLENKQTEFIPYYFDFQQQDCDEELICKAKYLRDYKKMPTQSQIEDMRYIVLTLGNEPLLKLKKFEANLKSAGDRVDEVHPLHFWKVIFTDSETISAIHNIKNRKFVWKPFIKGMGDSLQEAAERNNIEPESIKDFAHQIGVNKELFENFLHNQDWEGFAKALLTYVSRSNGTDRYDQ